MIFTKGTIKLIYNGMLIELISINLSNLRYFYSYKISSDLYNKYSLDT